MIDLIIIRGAPGVGKTTVAAALRDAIGHAVLFDVDYFCKMHGKHPKEVEARYFAHRLIALLAQEFYPLGHHIIIERMFKEQADIDHIIELFSSKKYRIHVFTLESSLSSVIARDSLRTGDVHLGRDVTMLLYDRFSRSDVQNKGFVINTENRSVEEIVKEIREKI